MNVRKGFRRIFAVLSVILFIFMSIFYIADYNSFVTQEYTSNIEVRKIISRNKTRYTYYEYSLSNFIELKNEEISRHRGLMNDFENTLFVSDIKCYPYLHKCDNDEIFKNKNLVIVYPSRFEFLLKEINMFLILLLFVCGFYVFYLIIEYAFCWIIKGFKQD